MFGSNKSEKYLVEKGLWFIAMDTYALFKFNPKKLNSELVAIEFASDRFIHLMKSLFDIQLKHDEKSIEILDSFIEDIRNRPIQQLFLGLYFYIASFLGQTFKKLFGGEWRVIESDLFEELKEGADVKMEKAHNVKFNKDLELALILNSKASKQQSSLFIMNKVRKRFEKGISNLFMLYYEVAKRFYNKGELMTQEEMDKFVENIRLKKLNLCVTKEGEKLIDSKEEEFNKFYNHL